MASNQTRRDPNALLARAQADEQRRLRGRLKIFLGYAAGVGKTYAMLDAAHQRRQAGADVVAGYVETHGRSDTEARLAGVEVLPRLRVEYRGVAVEEMDLDGLLARHPQLALVDELAHTNTPGVRHAKRYMDVEELLSSGIDVYTTVNIQHFESFRDVVAQITGVEVRETVPDGLLDQADEIELVDLPPEELLDRLREGKVYVPERAAAAIKQFFRKGNLTALRELALRRTAERVDDQMRDYMASRAISGPWAAGERLLVCVGLGASSERLVRAGRRLADQLNAEWSVLYVETYGHAKLSEADKDHVARALRLAEQLGARTIQLSGASVADVVTEYARAHNVTKIVVGQPLYPRWLEVLRGSVLSDIARKSGDIDVYVVSSQGSGAAKALLRPGKWEAGWQQYLGSLVAVALATLLGELVDPFMAPTNLVMAYLLAVVVTALRWGQGPSALAAVVSVLLFDLFFVPPRYTLAVQDLQYLFTFAGLLAAGLVVSSLAARAREQTQAAQRRQVQTAALFDLSRDLAAADSLSTILHVLVTYVSKTFGVPSAVLLPEGDHLVVKESSPGFERREDEIGVAEWSFRQGRRAGRGSDTLPAALSLYIPMKTANGTVGVLGVSGNRTSQGLPPDQRRLLEACTALAALAVERAQLAEQARRVEMVRETERLQTALLNSISHDLRTPLVSITGALSSLDGDSHRLDDGSRRALVRSALEQADRLNRLVGNLLDMTRLEANAVRVMREPTEPKELIGVALQEMGDRLHGREVIIAMPPDLPLVPMDLVLMARVLVNVVDNAAKYSDAETPIEIEALVSEPRSEGRDDARLEIRVKDRGIGVPADALDRIFDKFYRVERPESVAGTGLGLAISRGLVEAHRGRIWAEHRDGGGTTVTIALPLGEQPLE